MVVASRNTVGKYGDFTVKFLNSYRSRLASLNTNKLTTISITYVRLILMFAIGVVIPPNQIISE